MCRSLEPVPCGTSSAASGGLRGFLGSAHVAAAITSL